MPSKPSYDAGASGPQRKKKRSRPMVINLNGDVAAQFARYDAIANDDAERKKPAEPKQRWVGPSQTIAEFFDRLRGER